MSEAREPAPREAPGLLSGWKGKFKKFKGLEWVILLVIVGIVGSLALSDFTGFLPKATNNNTARSDLEARLAAILSSIDGAGAVDVMVYEGAQSVSASSDWFTGSSTVGSVPPVGVVVVADGAGDIRVQLELVRAVRTLMDLPASAVQVFQRKEGL